MQAIETKYTEAIRVGINAVHNLTCTQIPIAATEAYRAARSARFEFGECG